MAKLFPATSPAAAAAPVAGRGSEDIPRLQRCVKEYGFVAVNLNPDPSGGHWTSPPLSDRHWFPIYEALVEYDIPAMIHVSTSCNPCFHTTQLALPERRHDRVHAVPDI